MYQTLLNNKKQGKNYLVHAANTIKPTSLAFTGRNMFISMANRRSNLKVVKPVAALAVAYDFHICQQKSHIHIMNQCL
jgi:hypothetical protein